MKYTLAAILICSFCCAFAQDKDKTFSTSIGLSFTTTQAYKIQNKDTSFKNRLVVAPDFELRHKSGLGIVYTPYLVAGGSDKGLFLHKLSLSYEQYDKGNWDIDAAYSHFFFTNNPSIPFSAITNEVYGSFSYTKAILQPSFSGSFGFGQDEKGKSVTDVSLSAGFGHSFTGEDSAKHTSHTISPSLSLVGGTDEYSFLTAAPYKSRNSKAATSAQVKHKKRAAAGSASTTSTNTFTVSNIELGMYSSFTFGSFDIQPMGGIFFPLTKGSSVTGYWTLKFNYNF